MEGKVTVEKFEDLNVWQNAREVVKKIYLITNKQEFKSDSGLKSQIQRAAVSIMTNIAEGFERETNKDFANFLNYSKGSAGEVRSLLYIAKDLNYITEKQFIDLKELSITIIKQLYTFKKYLRNKKIS
ncbi:MAG: four helix bundle protein [Chlorobi bacterium]|nr:four helix bundle protein [Chlorobiota bacterium]